MLASLDIRIGRLGALPLIAALTSGCAAAGGALTDRESSCSATLSNEWVCGSSWQPVVWSSFSDSLGAGSRVTASSLLLKRSGAVEAHIVRGADIEALADEAPRYPYAGVVMDLSSNGRAAGLAGAEGITIKYRLAGSLDLMLGQAGVPAGEEFRATLPPAAEFTILALDWSRFAQPEWVSARSTFDLHRVDSIKFQVTRSDGGEAHLSIRGIAFPGHEF